MKKLLIALCTLIASSAQAQVIFNDNFNSNLTGLNAVPSGWTVSSGTVDIIGATPDLFNLIQGSGNFIDLVGSNGYIGVLSKEFSLDGNYDYTVNFLLAGNQRSSSYEEVTATLAGQVQNTAWTYTLAQSDGWTGFSLNLSPAASGTYTLSFAAGGASFNLADGGDNIGMLLDDVSITATVRSAITSPVPEPETYAMMLAGLGLLGAVARRRKQKLNA